MTNHNLDYGKTIKCKLKDILKDEVDYNLFFDCIKRADINAHIVSMFIRAYCIFIFNTEQIAPAIDHTFISTAFKVISDTSTCGPKLKGEKVILLDKMNNFFNDKFKDVLLNIKNIKDEKKECKKENKKESKKEKEETIKRAINNENKLSSKNLSYIYNLLSKEMATNYMNNIKMNFFKYVNQYVNKSFITSDLKKITQIEYKLLTKKEQIKYTELKNIEYKRIKIIKKELALVKEDLKNKTITSDQKYRKWINKHEQIIFPILGEGIKTYETDLENDPYKYLFHMMKMCTFLEKGEKKMFQCLPLRTDMNCRYISFDTSALKDIFKTVGSTKTHDELWDDFFEIDSEKYKIRDYSFNHMISTDGLAVSINFINNREIEGKKRKTINMTTASKKARQLRKGLTVVEIELLEKQKIVDKIEKIRIQTITREKQKEANKEAYKKLSKEEKEKLKKERRKKKQFLYIEDAIDDKETFDELKKALINDNICVVDPGMRDILTVLGKGEQIKDGNKIIGKKRKGLKMKNYILFSYSKRRRINELKTEKYRKLIKNKKTNVMIKNKTLEEIEKEHTKYNSKTVDLNKFVEYCKVKMTLKIELTKETTYTDYLRKLKWHSYINKRRHEDNILNELEKIYGKDMVFVVGDWSNKGCLKGNTVTPNLRIKKLLLKRFKVYLLDEFRTSKLHYETEVQGNNFKKTIKVEEEGNEISVTKKIHSILMFKTDKKRLECINRDYNATRNMLKIVTNLMAGKERPLRYRRDYKLEKKGSPMITILIDIEKTENKEEEPKKINRKKITKDLNKKEVIEEEPKKIIKNSVTSNGENGGMLRTKFSSA